MNGKHVVLLVVVLVVLTGGLLTRGSSRGGSCQWEYAVCQSGATWIWCAPGKLVKAQSDRDFATEMKMRYDGNGISSLYVVNHVGDQGWELLFLEDGPGNGTTYWFKRQR